MLYERLQIEGFLPERGLLRLKRSGIALYKAKKTQKNAILFLVKKKDVEKVFAIYPNVCYNSNSYQSYQIRKMGAVGLARAVDFFKNRAGLVLGMLGFCVVTLAADGLVLGVEISGSRVYAREVYKTLAEHGMKSYAFYPNGQEDIVTARLLSLSGVEFCSVQKIGHTVKVEMRLSPFVAENKSQEELHALGTGEVIAMSVLRGTALKKVGDKVSLGDLLVGNWFEGLNGERTEVAPIAWIRLRCQYEGVFQATTEEEAFAQAYLALGLSDGEVEGKTVTPTEQGYTVRLEYTLTQKVG